MNVKGKIKLVGETGTFGDNGFRKRELVITTDEQYPQVLAIEFVQDKVDLLDKFSVGENVDVSINLRGREWVNPQGETKYFSSLQGWRIVKDGTGTGSADSPPPAPPTEEEDNDDLPF